ncbi:YkvI family membrane protein [Kordiimonas marina]|uniref:YkvI family membrane protein n=1 Tax=Kordiimonas marina TaxID=2872312 RepID=UPI001FF4FE1A|nr:hypothetical protein [Kordiimonas marina]MCJ9427976.1 hypothetical protein [Kordiimonas marina]
MSFFQKYLLPGFMFQSVVIGGGYATGRELVEFFFQSGPIGGVLGLLVAGFVFGIVLALGFEFARVNGTYDYRQFCRALLGRAWVIFELAFVALLLLILSVLASAAGELVAASAGVPPIVGTLLLMALIALLTFYGTEVIKKVLSAWSFVLYAVYIALFVLAFSHFGSIISGVYQDASMGGGWLSGGVLYSGYNMAVLPTVLFAVRGLSCRRETMGAGLLAGAIAVIPAILFYVAMMALYPSIGSAPVPASALMTALKLPAFELAFQIVVFGTFVETGTALLHAVNERLDVSAREAGKTLPRYVRPVVAVALIIFAVLAGTKFGIINLIAEGYGALTLVFIGVLVLPLLTVGAWRVFFRGGQPVADEA